MFRTQALVAATLSFSLLLSGTVSADAGDVVLISLDDVAVTQEDFDRYVKMRIPERQRKATLDRPGAVRELIAQVFITRSLARTAEEQVDLSDPDLQWQIEFQRDQLFMESLVEQAVAEASARVKWEALADEHYRANIEDFSTDERVRASHILIATDERSPEQARELANTLAERARAGEDFAGLAREYSDDPSAERNSGDLGRFTRGRMVPGFEDAAFAMRTEGEISDPVETEFGFHIIRLESRQEPRTQPFEQVRDRIIRELQEKHARETRQELVERIRVDDRIEVNDAAVRELEESLRVDRSAGRGGSGNLTDFLPAD